jgi:hypothetical protein
MSLASGLRSSKTWEVTVGTEESASFAKFGTVFRLNPLLGLYEGMTMMEGAQIDQTCEK